MVLAPYETIYIGTKTSVPFYGDTVCFLMGTSTPKISQCRSSTQSMKFMQHVTRQSLAAVLTTHSLSQSRLQWQSPVQDNSDWIHLLRLLQLFSGSHEHFIKSWIAIVSFGRLSQRKTYHSLLSIPKSREKIGLDLERWFAVMCGQQ